MEIFDISDFGDFKELLSSARKKYGVLSRTNIYYMGEALIKWAENQLKYFLTDGGICFIKNESNQNKLYYALNNKVEYITPPLPDLITEFLCRDDKRKEDTELFLLKSGFQLRTVYYEMIKKGSGLESDDEYPLEYANHIDSTKLLALWESNLNTLEHPLPDFELLQELISKEQVVVLKNLEGEIIAAMVTRIEKEIGYIEYVFVDKNVRNRGFGKKLIENIDKILCVKKWFLFVGKDNFAAQQLYIKCGFTYSGRQLLQYYKI